MKRHRHTPEQAMRELKAGEQMLAVGKDLTEVLRGIWRSPSRLGIAGSTHTER